MSTAQKFDDRLISLCLARVSEAAALASADLIGTGDERALDEAAIAGMHRALCHMDISGTIVIGEGEPEDAPILFTGQTLGTGNGPSVDIALRPLEGRTLAAKGKPNALSVIALCPRGSMLEAPDIYMEKLAIGPGYPAGLVTLEMPPTKRVQALAAAKGCPTDRVTICVLDRPRHEGLIAEIRETGARIRLISDGDISGVLNCADPEKTGIDMYMGIGGAPEGVLAAAALKCLDGQMQGRLVVNNADEAARLRAAGITRSDRIYGRDDMVTGAVIFAASGITDGAWLKAVRRTARYIETETVLLRSKTGALRRQTYRRKLR